MAAVVSVVIPVYRSARSLPVLVPRLVETLRSIGRTPEVILVDDNSPDETWEICRKLKEQYPTELKIARLLTNRGQHNAILCGFYLCTGEVVVTMDDDLENPPEEVPKLVEAVDQGYDLAIAEYREETPPNKKAWRAGGSDLVNAVLRRIFHLPPGFHLTSFRAAKAAVVREASRMGGVFPYITAMLLCHSSSQCNVPVRHEPRAFGSSNYNLRRSLSLAGNLLLNYSSLPLAAVGFFAGTAFLASLGLGLWVLGRAIAHNIPVPGWASLMVITTFLHAVVLLSILIFGLYLIRINQQISRTKVRYTISELHE